MPRSWRGLPLPEDPRCLMKAPDYKTFLDQEYDGERFRLPRISETERKLAIAMVEAIPDLREFGQATQFIVRRYPTGVSVELPSGWTMMVPFDIPKGEKPTMKEKAEGNPVPTDPEKRARPMLRKSA